VDLLPQAVTHPAGLAARPDGAGYLTAAALAPACFPALKLRRPLFVEGDAGVGKTALAGARAGLLTEVAGGA
jgi:MoxR-like ATPase